MTKLSNCFLISTIALTAPLIAQSAFAQAITVSEIELREDSNGLELHK